MHSAFPQAYRQPHPGSTISTTKTNLPESQGLSLDEIRRIVLDLLG